MLRSGHLGRASNADVETLAGLGLRKVYDFRTASDIAVDGADRLPSGAESVLLLAHDWGALIAWQFAIRQVRPLEGLVIMNVPHPAVVERQTRNFRQLLRSWYILFFQIPWLPEFILGLARARAIGSAFLNTAVNQERFPKEVLDVYRSAARVPAREKGSHQDLLLRRAPQLRGS